MKRNFVTLHDDSLKQRDPRDLATKCFDPCSSCQKLLDSFLGFFPFVKWLPSYRFKEYIVYDLISGITIGILLIPLGIAFAALADLHPIYGLYASFFPIAAYLFVGSSPFLSVGPSSLLALMVGVSKNRILADPSYAKFTTPQVVSTVTFTSSVIMIITGVLRVDFLISFVSDELVDGYVFGASTHILVSQFKDILGYKTASVEGFGSVFVRIWSILSRIAQTNLVTLGIFVFSTVFLFVGKKFCTPKGVPVPYEVIIMIAMTACSAFFGANSNYGVAIIGDVPSGFPLPILPSFSLIGDCLQDALGIAIVGISFQLSMARVAQNRVKAIKPDYSQEVYAIGICNLVGSFFSTFPTAAGLGRTAILISSGAKTPFCSFFVALLILCIILWLGPLFEQLPMGVLAAVVIISMLPLFLKIGKLPKLWKTSKIDFSIWVLSCIVTILTDTITGFGVSFAYAIFTIVLRNQWPSWTAKTFKDNHICVYSFQSAVLFSNCGKFKKNFSKTFDLWEINSLSQDYHFVFDFSAVSAIDTMGIETLKEIVSEIRERRNVDVYFLEANETVSNALYRAQFFRVVSKAFFVDDLDQLEVAIGRWLQIAEKKEDPLTVSVY